ncbi:MAG: Flp pilus assembly complex ATPase component TadA [Lachnospiraceae bacterium]|nr:Flp pilus assembly complex ATPase component TadA [Lachnospiraceae bacterium]
MNHKNLILIAGIIVIVIAYIFYIYRKGKEYEAADRNRKLNMEYGFIYQGIVEDLKSIIYQKPEDLRVSYVEARKREEMSIKLSDAKRDAPVGSLSAKIYLTTQISKMLQTKYGVNEQTIDQVFPFDDPEQLDPHMRFLILMITVMQEHGYDTWDYLQKKHELDRLRENGRYEVYQSDIDQLFSMYVNEHIPYMVKLDVFTQKIFEDSIGHGMPDIMMWQNIEDYSGGLGGIPAHDDNLMSYVDNMSDEKDCASYNKFVILTNGKNLHLNFLGFGSQKELERVCRHIYQYQNPGEFSESVGFIENSMADGSRVVVFRAGFGDSWGFVVRKHRQGKLRTLAEMYLQKGCEKVQKLGEALMKGCQSCAITGPMYSGKTTLLTALAEKINPNYNLRGLESVFEMGLRELFPDRDIGTFMERTDIPGDKVLEFLKRTNGTVLLLGELLKEVAANWLISAGQSGFKFVMTTGHWNTTESMIKWLLNAKLNTSGSGDADLAMLDIIQALHFDIHCGLDELKGERYLERISEIVPTGDKRLYEIRDILIYDIENKEYRLINSFSDRTWNDFKYYMSDEEIRNLKEMFENDINAA